MLMARNFSDNLLFFMIASVSFIYLLTLAAQSRASSDAGGARLTLQRAAHAARHLLQSHRLTATKRTSRFS
ncbi:MFS-type transporter protein ycaD [Klebsiella pneumoniae subsp. ozaenae]|uniref:MFS-type transporter protein ycaD n=1 Tax=Klebsiella pneumoniae subsp. ozaenae TaxID=574 RepID=A0A378BQU3_KLEPO|nr:MFS-type transporter protein ycaD [Klebsiella pneumoniae subsp. ozaenae]